jgi:hypothetical protein
MKLNKWHSTALLFLATVAQTVAATNQTITQPDREKGLRYLAETRNNLIEAVKGLTEEQWKFKPAPDRWSAAEVLEHVVLIENMVHGILAKIEQAPAPAPDRDPLKVDALILTKVPDRSEKAQAPPPALPAGRWTPADTLDKFQKSRAETTVILKSASALRGHVVDHPVFGPLDGYEWILAVSAHSERHMKQILEVKADPHFPARKDSGH